MKILALLFVSVCLSLCFKAFGAPAPTPWPAPISTIQPCTFGAYNLSPMTLLPNSASNYVFVASPTVTYYVNVCANVIDVSGQNYCSQNTPSCQKDIQGSATVGYELGNLDFQTISSLPSSNATGVQITYPNGPNNCGPGTSGRTTILQISCDPQGSQGTIINVVEDPTCVYTFAMTSRYACLTYSTPTPTPTPGFPFQGLLVGTGVFASYQFQVEVTVSAGAGTIVIYNSTVGMDCVGYIKNMEVSTTDNYIGDYAIPDWYGSSWCPSAAGIYTPYQLELVSSSQAIWLGGFYGKLKPIVSNQH